MDQLLRELENRAPQIRVMEKISREDVKQLLQLVQDWSAAHGLLVSETSVQLKKNHLISIYLLF